MADEVRRSGRANKGHHTKNADALDEPVPKPKVKANANANANANKGADKKAQSQAARSQSAQSENEGEEDAVIRCVCGDQRDIRGRQMIACDQCEVWQHVKCLGLQEGEEWNTRTYYCEQCRPEDHQELLAAMERGEKPWNRKKGAKPLKGKPARPSDVRAEADQAPQSPAVATPTQPTPKESSHDHANGHGTAKGKKVEVQKTQPQSPTGEKRRRETASGEKSADAKRRKSSTQPIGKPHDNAPTISDPAALPGKQKASTEGLIKSLVTLIKTASEHRGFRIPDGETPTSIATRLALRVNQALVSSLGEPTDNDSPYIVQIRRIIVNTKANPVLLDRLLSGSLSADEIANMSAEDMASEEKQRENEKIREENDRQVVLVDEKGPRIRKTHKGDEIIDEEEQPRGAQDSVFTVPERRHRESVQEDRKPAGESPHERGSPMQVELPEDVGRAPLSVDTSKSPSATAARHPSSASFDVNQVWRQVRSPDQEHQQNFQRRQSSINLQPQQQEGPGDDADVDRLLKDEDNEAGTFSPAEYGSADPTVCWSGAVEMQMIGSFAAVARHVAGGDVGQRIPWNQLLPSTLPIQGRIDKERGNEYVASMRVSFSNDVTVLALSPVNDDGRQKLDALFNYFFPRNRWGVVPTSKLPTGGARDLYVVPIDAGPGPLPPFLDMLEYCTIETPRPHAMILLALVATTKSPDATPNPHQGSDGVPAGGSVSTPAQQNHGYPPAPGVHAGPQFSPVGGYPPIPYPPPQAPHYPSQHHQNPKAVEIFGPYIDAPVVVQILGSGQPMDEDVMRNLRAIMDREPAARTDFKVFTDHLQRSNSS